MLQGKSQQTLLDNAKHVLGDDRFNAVMKMNVKDLHTTYSVSYHQFNNDVATAMQDIINACFLARTPEYVEHTGRIQELRNKHKMFWTQNELNEWFDLWGQA